MSGDDKNEQSVMLSLDEILNQDPSLGGFNTTSDEVSPSTPQDVNLDELSRIGLTQDHVRAAPMTGAHLTQPLVLQERQLHPVLKALGLSLAVLSLLAGGIFLGVQFNKQIRPKTPPAQMPTTLQSSPKPAPVKSAIAPVAKVTDDQTKTVDVKTTDVDESKSTLESTTSSTQKVKSKSKSKSKTKRRSTRKSKTKKTHATKVEPKPEPKPEPEPESKPKPKPKKASAAANLLKSLNKNQKSASANSLRKSALPTKLTRSQILKVTRKNQRSINRCKAHTSGSVQAVVKVTVASSGSVSKANLRKPKNEIGSPLDQCLVSRIKAFKFPEFNGPPMRFDLPFFL